MTLHRQAAKIATKGRNGDSMLVHMSPEEVGGLHALALSAYGKPLTINPVTGVVEASLLKRLLPTIAGAVVGSVIPGAGTWGSAIAGGITSGFANGWKPRNILGGMLGGGSGRELVNRFAMAGTPVAPTASAQGGGAGPVTDEFGDALPKSARNVSAAPAPATTATGVAREAASTAAKGNAKPVKPTFKNVGEGIRSVLMDEKAREQFTKDNFWPIAAALGSYAMIPDKYNGPKNTPTRFWKQKLHRGTKVNPLWQQQQGQPYWTDEYWEDGEYTTEDPFAKGYASGGDVTHYEEPLKSIPDVMNTSVPAAAAPAQQYYSTDYKSSYHDPLMEYIDAVNARRKPVPKTGTGTGIGTGPGTRPRDDKPPGDDKEPNSGDGSNPFEPGLDPGGGGNPGGGGIKEDEQDRGDFNNEDLTPVIDPVLPTFPVDVTLDDEEKKEDNSNVIVEDPDTGERTDLDPVLPTFPVDVTLDTDTEKEDNSNVIVEDPDTGERTDREFISPYYDRGGLRDILRDILPKFPVNLNPPDEEDNSNVKVYDPETNEQTDKSETKEDKKKEPGFFDYLSGGVNLRGDLTSILAQRAIDLGFDTLRGDASYVTDENGVVTEAPKSKTQNRIESTVDAFFRPVNTILHPFDTVTGIWNGTPVKPPDNPIAKGIVGAFNNLTKTPEEIAREEKTRAKKEAAADRVEQSGAGQRGSGLTTRNSFDVTSPFFGGRGGNSVRPGVPYDARDQYGNPVGVAHGGMIGHYAGGGGIASLGGYSDGGRLLRGPGDGVSDDIPASIHRNDGTKQEARLADGEFVFPARIVSEIGNGSTEAGAKKLYDIMERIQRDRSRSLKDVAFDSNAERHFNSLMA